MTVFALPVVQPQQERSQRTHRRLLEAAYQSLIELGYARTTTTEVCRRSKVSRGTLLHHFPTTADLLTAAVDDVFHQRLREFRRAAERLSPGGLKASEAIDLVWDVYRGPTFYAWLELLVAARTDPKLLARVRAVMQRFDSEVQALYRELFPTAPVGGIDYEMVPSFVFAILNGLGIDRIFAEEEKLERTVNTLKAVGEFLERLLPTSNRRN